MQQKSLDCKEDIRWELASEIVVAIASLSCRTFCLYTPLADISQTYLIFQHIAIPRETILIFNQVFKCSIGQEVARITTE